MTFVSSLSSIAGLRGIPFINELLNAAPKLEPVLQVLAPFLVVLLNNALPAILTLLSSFEGPVALATVDASTFGKLAAFMIIQTFFVSDRASVVLLGECSKSHLTSLLALGINCFWQCPEAAVKYNCRSNPDRKFACRVTSQSGKLEQVVKSF